MCNALVSPGHVVLFSCLFHRLSSCLSSSLSSLVSCLLSLFSLLSSSCLLSVSVFFLCLRVLLWLCVVGVVCWVLFVLWCGAVWCGVVTTLTFRALPHHHCQVEDAFFWLLRWKQCDHGFKNSGGLILTTNFSLLDVKERQHIHQKEKGRLKKRQERERHPLEGTLDT